MTPLTQLISGGQTGVDRAVLDAALAFNFPCGGWCPSGREAEDGVIATHYPLQPLVSGGYSERSLRNVLAADGTVLIYFGYLSSGTEETLKYCLQYQRPYKLLDASELSPQRSGELILQFTQYAKTVVLNVTGVRASKQAQAYDYTYACITQLLSQCTTVG